MKKNMDCANYVKWLRNCKVQFSKILGSKLQLTFSIKIFSIISSILRDWLKIRHRWPFSLKSSNKAIKNSNFTASARSVLTVGRPRKKFLDSVKSLSLIETKKIRWDLKLFILVISEIKSAYSSTSCSKYIPGASKRGWSQIFFNTTNSVSGERDDIKAFD